MNLLSESCSLPGHCGELGPSSGVLWGLLPAQLSGTVTLGSTLHSFTWTLLRARQCGAAGLESARPWAQGAGWLGSGGRLQPPVPLTVPSCLLQARLDGGRQQWRPVLMAVTEKDLLLYDGMPWTRDAWASPCHSYPLVATRWAGGAGSVRLPLPGTRSPRPHPAPLLVPWLCLSPEQGGETPKRRWARGGAVLALPSRP